MSNFVFLPCTSSIPIFNAQLILRANRLVIAHGLLDENVHFVHTARLIEAMIKLNKPYTLKVSYYFAFEFNSYNFF